MFYQCCGRRISKWRHLKCHRLAASLAILFLINQFHQIPRDKLKYFRFHFHPIKLNKYFHKLFSIDTKSIFHTILKTFTDRFLFNAFIKMESLDASKFRLWIILRKGSNIKFNFKRLLRPGQHELVIYPPAWASASILVTSLGSSAI